MKEWILIRVSSILLLPAIFLYMYYSNPYIVVFLYLILAYHVIHGLVSVYEDYVQNLIYRNQLIFLTYLSGIFLFKVVIELVF
jgi:succinate dehydrogenase hydrophobic anchor subunit